MPDRSSFMLDNMITAVDEGFSYDGIVSIPETGLEDVCYQRDLATWLNDCVDGFGKAMAAFSQAVTSLFRDGSRDDRSSSSGIGLIPLPRRPPPARDSPSLQDSPIPRGSPSPLHTSTPPLPATPQDSRENEQALTEVGRRLPRLRAPEDVAHAVDQNLPVPENDGKDSQAQFTGQAKLPRKREEEIRPPNSGREKEPRRMTPGGGLDRNA